LWRYGVFSYWISLLLVLALPSGIFAATGKSDTSQGREGSNARAWFDKGYLTTFKTSFTKLAFRTSFT
jgi:hypothetical protein